MAGRIRWTPEMKQVVKDLYETHTSKEIAEILNEKFGIGCTDNIVGAKAAWLGLKGKERRTTTIYTTEQNEWLRENITKYTYRDLGAAFNNRFHLNRNWKTLKCHCRNVLKLKSGAMSRKGYTSWNSSAIGSERVSGNRVIVKVTNVPTTGKNREINWKDKGHLVWEQHHGKIPEGYRLVYLDGNKMNYDISNLECVSRSIQGRVSKAFRGTSPEVKRCAIKMKTLEKILEEMGSEDTE